MRTLYLTYPHMSGEDVRQFQSLVKQQGFDPGPIDGIYGNKSAEACKSFQFSRGMVASGVCDDRTWAALKGSSGGKSRIKAGTWNIKRGLWQYQSAAGFFWKHSMRS